MAGSQAALQFQATHSWEPVIEDQTITTAAGRCVQKLLRRCVTLCLHTGYFEQAPKGTTDLAFVVDDCDPMFHNRPLSGKATWLLPCVSIGPWSYIRPSENDGYPIEWYSPRQCPASYIARSLAKID